MPLVSLFIELCDYFLLQTSYSPVTPQDLYTKKLHVTNVPPYF